MNRKNIFYISIVLIILSLGIYACIDPVQSNEIRAGQKSKPNLLIILSDDLGYGELGCQGNNQIYTPNIDKIAKNGIRFTNGYVTCPACSPTRAGLLTGRYQQRFGVEYNLGNYSDSSNYGLPFGVRTLPARLKELGYTTAMFGKWHLGFKEGYLPANRGFDEFVGFLGGSHSYFRQTSREKFDRNNPVMRGNKPLAESEMGYTTFLFGHEAAAFIEKHHTKPWFVYLSFNAVHGPLEAPDSYNKTFSSTSNTKRRTFMGMTAAMDSAVGIVMEKIRDLGLEENTLIFFLSDNGGPTGKTTSSNTPLSGEKHDLLEGGIRIPFLLQWKGQIAGDRTDSRPVISLDIFPTMLAAANFPVNQNDLIDGVNLLPYLKNTTNSAIHNSLFWRYGHRYAVRKGDWKLVENGDGLKLFNLSDDLAEMEDLSSKEPEKVNELKSTFDRWNAGNIPPKWIDKNQAAESPSSRKTRQ